jgi:hypothetical protein
VWFDQIAWITWIIKAVVRLNKIQPFNCLQGLVLSNFDFLLGEVSQNTFSREYGMSGPTPDLKLKNCRWSNDDFSQRRIHQYR